MRPLRDNVVVIPDKPADTTASGLAIVKDWTPITQGTVHAVGDQVRDLKVGDVVIFSWQVGQEIRFEDEQEDYILLREKDINAVLEGA